MNVYTPVYKKWWFWMGVVVLLIAAFYVKGYINWGAQGAQYDEYAQATAEYVAQQKAQSAALEKAYREDMYGGATPEETLKLYVEALEKGDFELASKYFAVEKREGFLAKINQAVTSGGMKGFIDGYRIGKTEFPDSVGSSGIYEIKIFEKGSSTPFGIRLVKNEFTQKWKILEL